MTSSLSLSCFILNKQSLSCHQALTRSTPAKDKPRVAQTVAGASLSRLTKTKPLLEDEGNTVKPVSKCHIQVNESYAGRALVVHAIKRIKITTCVWGRCFSDSPSSCFNNQLSLAGGVCTCSQEGSLCAM